MLLPYWFNSDWERRGSTWEGDAKASVQVKIWTASITTLGLARKSKPWFRESDSVRACILPPSSLWPRFLKELATHALSTPLLPAAPQPLGVCWLCPEKPDSREPRKPCHPWHCVCYWWSRPTWNSLLGLLWLLSVPSSLSCLFSCSLNFWLIGLSFLICFWNINLCLSVVFSLCIPSGEFSVGRALQMPPKSVSS